VKTLRGAILLVGSSMDCPDLGVRQRVPRAGSGRPSAHGEGQYLVVPQLEFGRAQRQARRRAQDDPVSLPPRETVVFMPETLRAEGWQTAAQRVGAAAREEGRRRRGDGTRFLSARRGPGAGAARRPRPDRQGAPVPERAVKTAAELRKMRQSQEAGVIAMRAAIALIGSADTDRLGFLTVRGRRLTSEDVRAAISRVLLDGSAWPGTRSSRAERRGPIRTRRGGPPAAGEPIVIDIFPQHVGHGYWGD